METLFTASPIYAGEFRHAVDQKFRVTVPYKWRRAESEDLYVIPDQKNRYLIIMPPEEFKAIGRKIEANTQIDEAKKRIFLRNFYSQAQPTTVDRQGRMVIPEDYCKLVEISQEVVMAGGDVRFEIWNPDRWKATIEEKQDVYSEVADSIGL
jgi:MraZ protein